MRPLSVFSVTPYGQLDSMLFVHVTPGNANQGIVRCHPMIPPQTARRKKCKYLSGVGESELSV